MQRFACEIEFLLGVTHSLEQLAHECALGQKTQPCLLMRQKIAQTFVNRSGEHIDSSPKIDVSWPTMRRRNAARQCAAEIRRYIDLRRRIDVLAGSIHKCLRNFLAHQQTRLRFLSERTLVRELLKRMRDAQQEFDLARESLHRHVAHKIDDYRRGFVHIASALQARSPRAS